MSMLIKMFNSITRKGGEKAMSKKLIAAALMLAVMNIGIVYAAPASLISGGGRADPDPVVLSATATLLGGDPTLNVTEIGGTVPLTIEFGDVSAGEVKKAIDYLQIDYDFAGNLAAIEIWTDNTAIYDGQYEPEAYILTRPDFGSGLIAEAPKNFLHKDLNWRVYATTDTSPNPHVPGDYFDDAFTGDNDGGDGIWTEIRTMDQMEDDPENGGTFAFGTPAAQQYRKIVYANPFGDPFLAANNHTQTGDDTRSDDDGLVLAQFGANFLTGGLAGLYRTETLTIVLYSE